jgi:predicted signal transduction protein with EAL and GGDEF domain
MNRKLEEMVSEKIRDLGKSKRRAAAAKRGAAVRRPARFALTGLYNRTYFMEKLDEFYQYSRVRRKGNAADVERGQPEGHQRYLWALHRRPAADLHAQNVKRQFEGTGVLARLSGDEFACCTGTITTKSNRCASPSRWCNPAGAVPDRRIQHTGFSQRRDVPISDLLFR